MIRTVEVRNFRCYRGLKIDDCGRLNLIVGDNGSGKTALLEAMFLALATSSEVAVRLRQQRGIDGSLGGTVKRIEQGLWGDFFHNYDWTQPIRITLTGDGPEARSLEIARGGSEATLPLSASDLSQLITAAPVTFTWTDAHGQSRVVTPTVSSIGGITLPETGEDMPNFYFIPAGITLGSVENASRFSELSKANRHRRFVDVFVQEYDWIEDLDVEVHTGSPAIFATIKGSGRKIPLANVSAGINRMLGIMLAISSLPRSVVLVDEIENGIFHTHLASMWKTLLSLLTEYESQLFVSTHSQECLEALVHAAPNHMRDIVLLRTERGDDTAIVRHFSGKTLMAGVEYGEELR